MHVFDLCGINNIEESIRTIESFTALITAYLKKFFKSYKRRKNKLYKINCNKLLKLKKNRTIIN